MSSNLEKYKKDIDSLLRRGKNLINSLSHEVYGDAFLTALKGKLGDKAEALLKDVPVFSDAYQAWYSEAKALVRQLLPDRLEDFCRLYEKPKSRKDITFENYTIEDALQGLVITRGYAKEKVVNEEAAIPRMQQQIAIVQGAKARFESSLFDIRQLLQADIFDSELEAANHLLKNKFSRAAGALAGVVLERHLGEVASSHGIPIKKKNPTVSDLNDALKAASVIDTAQWRSIQLFGDIRNLCDHSKAAEPTQAQVKDLLDGVAKIIKTVF